MQDNLASVKKLIADHVLQSRFAESIVHGKNGLEEASRLESRDDYGFDVALSTDDNRVSIHVDFSKVYCYYERDYNPKITTDDLGNQWVQYEVKFKVSYPSYTSSPTHVVRERLKLASEACDLAEELERLVKDVEVWSIWMTAQEAKDYEQKQAQKQQVEDARNYTASFKGGMRVGSSKVFKIDANTALGAVEIGWTREFLFGAPAKKFAFTKVSDSTAVVCRIE